MDNNGKYLPCIHHKVDVPLTAIEHIESVNLQSMEQNHERTCKDFGI